MTVSPWKMEDDAFFADDGATDVEQARTVRKTLRIGKTRFRRRASMHGYPRFWRLLHNWLF
jgi:hypothetical protein